MKAAQRVAAKRTILLVLALSALGLLARSFYVWNNCGYDCQIFPAFFPIQLTSTFGGLLGLILLLALAAIAMSALLEKGE
ncbi:MAG TPA: hypothetical protein VJ806_05400 [Luteimonas sp.]|nr:hypothetical protein [Luteimonas sp.]